MVANQMSPQLLVAAMVFDGVFERHPKLTLVVEEVGASTGCRTSSRHWT